jgi:hypothetical protein
MRHVACAVIAVATLGLNVGAQNPFVVKLAVPGRANATPSIAAADPRVAVAWGAREPSGKTDVFVATSANGGHSFGAPVRVNDEPGTARVGGETPPRVAFVGYAIDVVWTSRENDGRTTIRVARSESDGRTFGPSRELQLEGAPGDRGWPAAAADTSGRRHMIWLDHRGLAAEGNSHHVHGAAPTAGEKRDGVAMAQKSSLFYAGAAGENEIAKGVCYCCKTALATAANGTIFAAWRHVFADNIRDIAFTVSRDGGRTFAPFVRVSEDRWQLDGCPDDGPALTADERGVAHVAWPTVVSSPEPHKAIFYASTRDGRTFSERKRVSPVGLNAAHPQIAIDPLGRPFVTWDALQNGRRRVFIGHLMENGAFTPGTGIGRLDGTSYPAIVRSGESLLIAATGGTPMESVILVHQIWFPQ